MRRASAAGWALVLLAMGFSGGCRPADPRAEVLEQRARFTVELLSWIPRDDGTIAVIVRVAGPPSTTLERLTFRISQHDSAGEELAGEWRTIDLAELPRGGPKDMFFTVRAAAGAVEGVGTTLVQNPTAEQAREIVELQGL